MHIVCPSCDTAYEVPDPVLGSQPRRLRCARCAYVWVIDPPIAVVEAERVAAAPRVLAPPESEVRVAPMEPAEPSIRSIRALMSEDRLPTRPRSRSWALPIAAWTLSLLLLAGIAAGAVTWRDEIMAAWPPSVRLYAALGLKT